LKPVWSHFQTDWELRVKRTPLLTPEMPLPPLYLAVVARSSVVTEDIYLVRFDGFDEMIEIEQLLAQ
jgi:hypothetical protein